MLTNKPADLVKRLAASLFFMCPAGIAHAATIQESLNHVTASSEYVEISASTGVSVDLRYASINNFVGQKT
jgi:hypothetical protein